MKNLKIIKTFVSLMLVLVLTTSSFAMGPNGKKSDKNVHNNKVKIEQKYHNKDVKVVKDHQHKKDVKIVKVYTDNHHNKHYKHHKHHNKTVVYCNGDSNFAAKCLGTGLCLIMLAAVNG